MAQDRYTRGKIYRLMSAVDDNEYIGSTCKPLCKRLSWHRAAAKKKGDTKVYQHFNEIGWGNVRIILIEEYPCQSKMELERREAHWIRELKPTLNKNIPTRTVKEYYEDNKEIIAEKLKQYREQNKEVIAEYKKQYREQNKEVIAKKKKQYQEQNKEVIAEKLKQYREQNKEVIAEKAKQYREQNKEVIAKKKKQYASTRLNCPHCNKEMNRGSLNRHIKNQHQPS